MHKMIRGREQIFDGLVAQAREHAQATTGPRSHGERGGSIGRPFAESNFRYFLVGFFVLVVP